VARERSPVWAGRRAEKLAGQAVNVWSAPKLKPAVLDAYKPKVEAKAKK